MEQRRRSAVSDRLIFMVKTCLQTENTKVVGKVFFVAGFNQTCSIYLLTSILSGQGQGREAFQETAEQGTHGGEA